MTTPRPTITPTRIDPTAIQDVKGITLFVIGDAEYTVPEELSPNDALIALRMARTRGSTAAMSWMAETAIGEKGYDALIACPGLTKEQITEILTNVQRMYLGDLEAMTGN